MLWEIHKRSEDKLVSKIQKYIIKEKIDISCSGDSWKHYIKYQGGGKQFYKVFTNWDRNFDLVLEG